MLKKIAHIMKVFLVANLKIKFAISENWDLIICMFYHFEQVCVFHKGHSLLSYRKVD